ncbi:MAG: PAS domain S-box protein [Candidatus Thiodiazotropha sp.]|nr:PAS domain S-box protein [Candidatus Thiodiazotropha sp.]
MMPTTHRLSKVKSESGSRSDLRLTTRYRWLLLVITLPLFIVIMVLAANQYHDLRTQISSDLSQNTARYSIALEGIAKLANDHVLQMHNWSESFLRSPPSHPSELRAYYSPRIDEAAGTEVYTLDNVPENKREIIGQLIWYAGDPRRPEVGKIFLDHALEFFALARLTHSVTPYFQWSYFFSAKEGFIALYPWMSTDQLLEIGEYATPIIALDEWFEYEIYLKGTPELNPRRKSYWTAPYIDAGGTGVMVSYGAPVYVDDNFLGIVGTDLRLATLDKFLAEVPLDVGRLLILDQMGMLLADSAGTPKDTLRKAVDIESEALNAKAISIALSAAGKPQEANTHTMVAQQIEYAPWTLVYIVSNEEIMGLMWPRVLPYAVILLVLVATVFLALYLMRREFISPALALVHYIRDASRDPSVEEPKLPPLWQTWVASVTHAFTSTRDATYKLKASEERLQQILNNSSAVVYVRDLEERFLLINQPFQRLFGITKGEIVGKHLDELFPPETAAELRNNDLQVIEQDSVMEFEEKATLDDGIHTYISNKSPLYDSTGKIYAICSISTDITKRKQSEEALRQAALGISEAQSEDVFNSLVMHLSKAVGTDYAFIGVLENANQIQTRALYAHGRIEENISYSLDGSPCANVVGQQFHFYPDTIQLRFPDDRLLQEIEMESYAAIPLFNSTGNVLGLLAVLHSQPLQDENLIESILQVFAGRAVHELEREHTDMALRASEASYRAIFEASEDAIFVHDMDSGAILDVNRKACEAYGYSREEMRHVDVGVISSGIPPYTQDEAAKFMARAVAGERLCFEWHRKNRDGTLHWDEVFIRCASIGGQDRILAFTREITARKEAEEKLRASEAQYREANRKLRDSEAFKSAIVEKALLGIITINEAGFVVEFNPASVEMFGYDKHRAIGCNLTDLIIPETHHKAHSDGLARYLRTGEARVLGKRLELTAIRVDGSEFPVELSISANRVGDTNYFTAFITDLTGKRAAEIALRTSEEQYRSIFNAASDALILWDAQGKMVDANPAAWNMAGYTKKEFFKKPFHEHIHASSLASLKKFKSDVATAKAASTETRVICKDCTLIDLESRSIPMPYRGQPHILTITRDITEQKKVAEELAHQREALRQSEKLSAMGELLAGVAHELNNPLAILMGRTALLENKTKDQAIKADVEKIHTAADRCGRIVRTFLAMARQKPPERKPGNLNDVVTSAIELLGYALRTSGIELQSRLSSNLPKQPMDVDQVGQIIINLLVNAQHMLTEQPEPRHIVIETGESAGGVYCRVTDNGPGVPDELRQRIFDPFFTTKSGNVGTGIGLSVSRSIAREHGGKLQLEAMKSGSGAAFILWLPLDPQRVTIEPAAESPGMNKTQGGYALIVEDEPEVADLLVEILQSAGLKATWVSSGLEAIRWLEKNTCDLILSDIRMPDMDGPGLWRALEQQYPDLLLHTAFITGDTLSAAIAPFLKETGAPLLEKPFTPEQVLALVARLERN